MYICKKFSERNRKYLIKSGIFRSVPPDFIKSARMTKRVIWCSLCKTIILTLKYSIFNKIFDCALSKEIIFFYFSHDSRDPFLEGPEKFSHPESRSKISNLLTTELFYPHILKIWTEFSSHKKFHWGWNLSIFSRTKNNFTSPKNFPDVRETGLREATQHFWLKKKLPSVWNSRRE